MDFKRMVAAMVLSMLILMGWEHFFPTPKTQPVTVTQSTVATTAAATPLTVTQPFEVTTDLLHATIDEKSGDLRNLTLNRYEANGDAKQKLVLFSDGKPNIYVAQAQLVDANGANVLANVSFQAAQKSYVLNGEQLDVHLSATMTNGLQVEKVYTFHKNSYLVNVRFNIKNSSGQTVKLGTAYSIVRDNSKPDGDSWFTSSYNGPMLYTPDSDEFQKVQYADLDKDFEKGTNSAEYQRKASGGYVGMIQHHFVSAWIMQPENGDNICANTVCTINVTRRADNLYSAGVNVAARDVVSGSSQTFSANLYAGPQVTSILKTVAPKFELTKDYGRVHIFAAPLFALLDWLHKIIGNWGWAIIVLTLIVKAVLFPLNQKAYQSMAKMRAVAPKLEALKKKYPNPEDRMALQTGMMQLYRDEKINPLGGCLPMLIQLPIFIGL